MSMPIIHTSLIRLDNRYTDWTQLQTCCSMSYLWCHLDKASPYTHIHKHNNNTFYPLLNYHAEVNSFPVIIMVIQAPEIKQHLQVFITAYSWQRSLFCSTGSISFIPGYKPTWTDDLPLIQYNFQIHWSINGIIDIYLLTTNMKNFMLEEMRKYEIECRTIAPFHCQHLGSVAKCDNCKSTTLVP